jgi:hypothetical protein
MTHLAKLGGIVAVLVLSSFATAHAECGCCGRSVPASARTASRAGQSSQCGRSKSTVSALPVTLSSVK